MNPSEFPPLLFFLLVPAVITNCGQSTFSCPAECDCYEDEKSVVCGALPSFPRLSDGTRFVKIKALEQRSLTSERPLPSSVNFFYIGGGSLEHVDGDFFSRGSRLNWMSIENTKLKEVNGNMLHNVKTLAGILLSNNSIVKIAKNAFSAVPALAQISLSRNRISAENLEEALCQANLTKLTVLRLAYLGWEDMPPKMLTCAPLLTTIYADGNNFRNTNSLSSLTEAKNVQQLFLRKSNISQANFPMVKRLVELQLDENPLQLQEVHDIICKLPKTLKRLSFRSIAMNALVGETFECLNNTRLISLDLSYCNISFVATKAFLPLRQLQTLRLDNNLLDDVSYKQLEPLQHLTKLSLNENTLKSFKASGSNGSCALPNLRHLDLGKNYLREFHSGGCLRSVEKLFLGKNNIGMRNADFHYLERLLELELYSNGVIFVPRNSFPPNLERLDFSNNQVGGEFTRRLRDLRHLKNLALNGLRFSSSGSLKNLENLTGLGKLELDGANIEFLPGRAFKNLTSLYNLQLAGNKLHHVPVDVFSGLPRLSYLDLVGNKIQTLPESPQFMRILNRSKHFAIDSNPFVCNCSIVWFLKLVQKKRYSKIIFNPQKTQCEYPSKYQGIQFSKFELPMRECISLLPIILPSALGGAFIIFTTLTVLIIRYRGYIRYGCMLVVARAKGYRPLQGERFKWDAFISYNNEDREWVLRRLRPKLEDEAHLQVSFHDRDFAVGRAIVDNIIDCIDRSRKTILVLSDSFAKSQWCEYEMSLAQHKLFEEDRDVLILVKLGEIAQENMTKRLRVLMRTKTFIEWPASNRDVDLFWRNLLLALERPPGVIMEEPDRWPIRERMLEEQSREENSCRQAVDLEASRS